MENKFSLEKNNEVFERIKKEANEKIAHINNRMAIIEKYKEFLINGERVQDMNDPLFSSIKVSPDKFLNLVEYLKNNPMKNNQFFLIKQAEDSEINLVYFHIRLPFNGSSPLNIHEHDGGYEIFVTNLSDYYRNKYDKYKKFREDLDHISSKLTHNSSSYSSTAFKI